MAAELISLKTIFSKHLLPSYTLTAIGIILSIISFLFLPKEIPLWYSLPIAEQQLVPKIFIFLFPALMVVAVSLIHSSIILHLRAMDQTIVRIFSYTTTLIILLFLLGLIHSMYIFL
jgi:hypothetical protein